MESTEAWRGNQCPAKAQGGKVLAGQIPEHGMHLSWGSSAEKGETASRPRGSPGEVFHFQENCGSRVGTQGAMSMPRTPGQRLSSEPEGSIS